MFDLCIGGAAPVHLDRGGGGGGGGGRGLRESIFAIVEMI